MKTSKNRGILLAATAAALLSAGFLSNVNATESAPEKFNGMKVANSCGGGGSCSGGGGMTQRRDESE